MTELRPSHLTSKQQTVFNWVCEELALPVFAEAYSTAIQLFDAKTPGYITIVAHVGRDITNSLAKTVSDTESGRGRVKYRELVDAIRVEWSVEREGRGLPSSKEDNQEDESPGGHLVTNEAYERVKDLLAEDAAGTERDDFANFLFFKTFLAFEDIEDVPEGLLQDWKQARKWFQAFAHCRKGCFSEEDHSESEKNFKTLHSMLHLAASSELGRLRRVDAILEETNK